jgi:uncharacterized membrane protein YukC
MGCHTFFFKSITRTEKIEHEKTEDCGIIIKHDGSFYETINDYHDVFRVKHYPRKTIHSLRELRRWLRKDYFKLSLQQTQTLREYWSKYPGGIIRFG